MAQDIFRLGKYDLLIFLFLDPKPEANYFHPSAEATDEPDNSVQEVKDGEK